MKKHVKLILTALAVYIVLLLLLLAAEAGDASASIRSFWDAVWFSLITMTTVGYGDLAPVTVLGRVIGLLFALCSIGLLTALIGIGITMLSGEFLPRMRLRRGRTKRWYAFQEENEDAAALYASWTPEWESKWLDDADVVITAYGISARIAESAAALLRKEGVKVGLVRPITVHPFPFAAYEEIDYSKVKAVLDVEMSIPAQFVKDVETAVKGRCPIETCLCSGGNIMSREAIVDSVRRIMEGK